MVLRALRAPGVAVLLARYNCSDAKLTALSKSSAPKPARTTQVKNQKKTSYAPNKLCAP